MHLSSQRDNQFIAYCTLSFIRECVFSFRGTSGPHSIAVAVAAKNSPPDCFLNAATGSQRDNQFIAYYTLSFIWECVFSFRGTSGPHSISVAVAAKNSPPDCFLNAATGSQRDNQIIAYYTLSFIRECVFCFNSVMMLKSYWFGGIIL